mgnify:FL=1
MNLRRILALATRIVHQFRRDRRTLFLLFVVPVLVLSLLAWIYRGDGASPVTLAIVNEGQSPLAAQIVTGLQEDASLTVREMDAAAAMRALDQGEVDAVLTLPADLSLRPGGPPQQIEVTLDGSDPSTTSAVMGALTRTLPETVVRAVNPAGLPIQIEPRFLHGGPEFDRLDYLAPVIIGFFVFFFVFLLTSVSFLRERSEGSIERLIVSPLGRGEIVLGYMLGFTLFAALQGAVTVLFAVYALRIHYVGNLGLVFLFTLLLTLGAVNLGIFLSTFARTELQVVQFIPLVIVPQALLSGILWPIDSLPEPLQWLAHALPLTYAAEALRGVMIRGDGLAALWVNLAVLAGFAVLMIVLGTSTLRREAA